VLIGVISWIVVSVSSFRSHSHRGFSPVGKNFLPNRNRFNGFPITLSNCRAEETVETVLTLVRNCLVTELKPRCE